MINEYSTPIKTQQARKTESKSPTNYNDSKSFQTRILQRAPKKDSEAEGAESSATIGDETAPIPKVQVPQCYIPRPKFKAQLCPVYLQGSAGYCCRKAPPKRTLYNKPYAAQAGVQSRGTGCSLGMCLSICLSSNPSMYTSVCPSFSLCIHQSVNLCICLHPSVRLSLSTYVYTHISHI